MRFEVIVLNRLKSNPSSKRSRSKLFVSNGIHKHGLRTRHSCAIWISLSPGVSCNSLAIDIMNCEICFRLNFANTNDSKNGHKYVRATRRNVSRCVGHSKRKCQMWQLAKQCVSEKKNGSAFCVDCIDKYRMTKSSEASIAIERWINFFLFQITISIEISCQRWDGQYFENAPPWPAVVFRGNSGSVWRTAQDDSHLCK